MKLLGVGLAVAAESIPQLPGWVGDLSLVGAIVLFGLALARNWIYTSGQVNRMIEAYDKLLASEQRVSELWRHNAEMQSENVNRLIEGLEPVTAGNAAILRAVEEIQREQLLQREYRRDQGGR